VGLVCALAVELAAAQDDEHASPACDTHDTSIYGCGQVGENNAAIACLSEGQMGTNVCWGFDVPGSAVPPARRVRSLGGMTLVWFYLIGSLNPVHSYNVVYK